MSSTGSPVTRYTKDHEYVTLDGDVGTVGITEFAQGQLGDVVYVELPEIGRELVKGGEAAVVESVKAASEVFSPVSGTVVEVNAGLPDGPSAVNEDPQGGGWFFKIRVADPSEFDALLDEESYRKLIT